MLKIEVVMSRFRLTVWRPFRSDRDLHYPIDSDALEKPLAFTPIKLQEAIYSWSPEQDVLAGITDEALRAELRALLFSSFAASLPPEERTFVKLAEAVQRLEQLASIDNPSNWTDTAQLISQNEDSPCALRCSPTIALYHQLNWLLGIFGDVPGLSVMIR